MIEALTQGPVRPQIDLQVPPYDSWLDPDGETVAAFHRLPGHYLVRFPDRCDFEIDRSTLAVTGYPVDEEARGDLDSLFHNAIVPLVGNHQGRLHLHGSAVVIGGKGYAFMGLSRRGKTTLAGAFAARGHPYLTEDAVVLDRDADGRYRIKPTRPVLRLFADSARHLLGRDVAGVDEDEKNPVPTAGHLPFASQPAPLGGIFFLGPGESDCVEIARLPEAAALAELMPHAFVLDVEDKARLRRHFDALGVLVRETKCCALDFPRIFTQLDKVVNGVVAHVESEKIDDDSR